VGTANVFANAFVRSKTMEFWCFSFNVQPGEYMASKYFALNLAEVWLDSFGNFHLVAALTFSLTISDQVLA